jgi:hypothetical protein
MNAHDTLQTLMKHIMHRERASFTRFDDKAFSIMHQEDALGQEMKYVYHANLSNFYKASVHTDTSHPFNPMLDMAQEDINYCTRFLKLIKKYTSLIITDKPLPADLTKKLFKKGCTELSMFTSGTETLKELIDACNDILSDINEFTVVVTSLNGISPLLHYRLILNHNILLIDMDALYEVLANDNQQCIDISRFNRLMSRNIIILSTAALIDGSEIYKDYNRRKAQYIKSIEMFNAMGYEPYIVEVCAAGSSFLDDYCYQVLYTQSNDLSYPNKGINEAISMKIFLDTYKDMIKDDDIIIKTTGRYHCTNDNFIRLVENNDRYCGFVKHRLQKRVDRHYVDIFTGLFALEARYFKNMLTSIPFEQMGTDVWFEWDVARYIYTLAERHVPIMYLNKVYMHHYKGIDDKEHVG